MTFLAHWSTIWWKPNINKHSRVEGEVWGGQAVSYHRGGRALSRLAGGKVLQGRFYS